MKLVISSLIFILFILMACNGSKKSKVNCMQWHTGKFEIVDDSRNVLIERDATVQIETDRNTGSYTKFKVDWIDNCTYQLRFMEGEEGVFQAWQNNFLQVVIVGPTSSGFRYRAKFSTSNVIEEGEIRQIE